MNQESGRAPPSTWIILHITRGYHRQASKDIQAANGSLATRQTNSRPVSVGNGEDKAPPESSHCHPIGFAKVNSTTEVGPEYPSNSEVATKNNAPREAVRRKNTSPHTARDTFVARPLVRKAKELAGGSRISSRQCQGARHPSALGVALSLHSTNCM